MAHGPSAGDSEIDDLRRLDELLRAAIRLALEDHGAERAVALAIAHDFVAAVLADPHPTATRVALARARAELALESWRQHLFAAAPPPNGT